MNIMHSILCLHKFAITALCTEACVHAGRPYSFPEIVEV